MKTTIPDVKPAALGAAAVKAAVLAVAVACALGFVMWRARVGGGKARARDYNVILADPSASAADVCESVERLAGQAVALSGARGSFDLTLYRLGDEASANDPVLVERYSLAPNDRSLESQNAPAEQRRQLIRRVRERCEELPSTEASPIFHGARTVAQQMAAEGCGRGEINCRLFLQSDMQELAEPGVRDAIKGRPAKKRAPPSRIENAGISVRICGYAQTNGRAARGRLTTDRDPQLDDRLREVWRGLFTHPDLVEMSPFCR